MVIIMRGPPGSGKSSKAKQLKSFYEALDFEVRIFSTDDYFMRDGKYCFNAALLGKYHAANYNAFSDYIRGKNPADVRAIIDNTNVKWKDFKSYVKLGIELGHSCKFVEPTTPWKFDAEECAKRNKHNVPLEVIKRMLNNWESAETIKRKFNDLVERVYLEGNEKCG